MNVRSGWSRLLIFDTYGSRVTSMRKVILNEIGGRKADRFQLKVEEEVNRYLLKLLNDPSGFTRHLRWYVICQG